MRILLVVALLFSISLASNDFAFRVNTATFPLSDFDKQFMASLEQYKKDFLIANDNGLTVPELQRLKYGVLDTLIDKEILLDYSKSNKIMISNERVKAYLAELKKKYPSPDDFDQTLKIDKIKPSQLMESLRLHLTKEAIIDHAFKDPFIVTSRDILLYIRQKNISLFPIYYDLSIAVTNNRAWLDSLRPDDFVAHKWHTLRLNMEYSSFNMVAADSDLDFAMQSFLDTLEMNVLSPSCPFDDTNFYRVRINQLQLRIPSTYRDMVAGIKAAILDEKRSQKLETWLKEQRQKTFVKVNIRAFPDFYHREARGTLE
jgi:hypothetical protein